jgi:predicted RNA-binding Zn-ribbon protein involved in translation (DUF1610 family)
MNHVDGNALAGALSLVFGRDMTTAESVCSECGDRHPIATTHVYLRCPGMVMRCPNCGAAEVVLTEIRGHIDLHVRSVATIHLV